MLQGLRGRKILRDSYRRYKEKEVLHPISIQRNGKISKGGIHAQGRHHLGSSRTDKVQHNCKSLRLATGATVLYFGPMALSCRYASAALHAYEIGYEYAYAVKNCIHGKLSH